ACLVQEALTRGSRQRFSPGKAGVEVVVVANRRFTEAPAKPHVPAVDLAIEVAKTDAGVFDHGAERLDRAPTGLVRAHAALQVVLHAAELVSDPRGCALARDWGVCAPISAAVCRHGGLQLVPTPLDVRGAFELLADELGQLRHESVRLLDGPYPS